MADIMPYLERIRARFDLPDIQASFQGFAKTLQFIFPDLQRNFVLRIAENGTATLSEESLPQPDIKVTSNSDLLAGIMDRKVNPIQAYITRKLKVTGNMDDLLRLQKIL
ncbi:MAG TPA: SCP2 sterol-binding domain-containing protein [Ktedonobacteraceae bacterium]|jgi:putative sterol carrier protein|nr:SCP2 sterol-binding domain-containing protein [Ktedonobacteraceae bacterium]